MENTNKINPLDNGNDSLTHYNYNLIKATMNNLHYHINATASRYATISTTTNNHNSYASIITTKGSCSNRVENMALAGT